MTPTEQRLRVSRAMPDVASCGCLVILFGIGPDYLLGRVGGWGGGLVSTDASNCGQWIGWSLSAKDKVLGIWELNGDMLAGARGVNAGGREPAIRPDCWPR